MHRKKMQFIIMASLLMVSALTNGQNTRGFYLTGISSWLGNSVSEDEILQYALGNGFNYISLYNLSSVNWSSVAEKNKLAAFISKARNQYGISEMGAVVENYAFVVNSILPYNDSRSNAVEKFDVINLEFEFWSVSSINSAYCNKYLSPGGYSCDSAGAFRFGIKQFRLIDSICTVRSLTSEVYLGWPNQGQMQQLALVADRILLHAYRPNDGDVYVYSRSRLIDIASINKITQVIPLFSGEPVFMGPWLNSNHVSSPYRTYSSDYNAETATFKQYIDLQGYQWFTYNYLPKTTGAHSIITSDGPISFCSGDSVVLTANSGTSYSWSPGGQTTQSIIVLTPGSYTVSVTNSGGLSATSIPVVVTYSTTGTTPNITTSGMTTFCPGGSVTLTSDQAGSYLWSNGATTRSITVTTSGNYTVTTGNGTCTATSLPVIVNAMALPSVPIITANGSYDLCSGKFLVLSSSAANNYLWSNGATTRSIIVSSSGNYFVNAGSGPNCTAQSAVQNVNILPTPAVPIITANGSLSLTQSQPSVTLSSTVSNSYLWSTGEITSSIAVSTPGVYRVTITEQNGCTAISDPVTISANNCMPPPVPTISIGGSNIISSGQTVTLTSSPAAGYLWSNGSTSNSITVSDSGAYSVRCYNAAGCFSTSLPVEIIMIPHDNSLVSLSEFPATEKIIFSLYPNPVIDAFTIDFNTSKNFKLELVLFDVTGRTIQNEVKMATAGENSFTVDNLRLKSGIYFVSVFFEGERQVLKFIVQ